MMKGFKIDLKGQKQRMAYQEKQRIQSKTYGYEQTKGQLKSFVSKLVK